MESSISYQKELRRKTGGAIVYAGAFILIFAPLISFLLLQVTVSAMAGRTVTWDEMMEAMDESGLKALICGGFFIDIALGFAAIGLGLRLRSGYGSASSVHAAAAAIVVGVVGAVVSLAIIGGIVGVLGGVLVAVGGGLGLS